MIYCIGLILSVIEYNTNLHIDQFNVGFQFITNGYRYNRFGDGGRCGCWIWGKRNNK